MSALPGAAASTVSPAAAPITAGQGWFALLARYAQVLGAAWAGRGQVSVERTADERAFLPAALSLQETPVHPAPRRLAWAVMALFAMTLAWACIGEIDIVAVAPGRIIVSERTKLIQPLEASVVRRILVKDGDHVVADQVLVELDPTMAAADKANVQEQWSAAAREERRSAALLKALASGHAFLPPHPLGEGWGGGVAQLQSEWQDIHAKLAKLDAEATRRRAEMATTEASIAKLEATLPLARAREADFKKLVDQGYISGHATQDKTRERIELERDLDTQRARLAEGHSALVESAHAKAAFRAETRRLLNDRLAQAASKRQQLDADRIKASQRERLTQLRAPVAGTVQQLAVHSMGGVVTSAQPLMVVVPETEQVTAEVTLANLDIGFVQPGQMAAIKLETFPYTRYGTVAARVQVVTADAVTDEKKGAYFPATLVLQQKDMDIDGKRVSLSPGMNVTAEIKTGKRRVIDYLLSPIQRAGSESLRER